MDNYSSVQKVQDAKSRIVGPLSNRITHIEHALHEIYSSNVYPKSSIEELDLRIQLS